MKNVLVFLVVVTLFSYAYARPAENPASAVTGAVTTAAAGVPGVVPSTTAAMTPPAAKDTGGKDAAAGKPTDAVINIDKAMTNPREGIATLLTLEQVAAQVATSALSGFFG